jgi:hypothetical protein
VKLTGVLIAIDVPTATLTHYTTTLAGVSSALYACLLPFERGMLNLIRSDLNASVGVSTQRNHTKLYGGLSKCHVCQWPVFIVLTMRTCCQFVRVMLSLICSDLNASVGVSKQRNQTKLYGGLSKCHV